MAKSAVTQKKDIKRQKDRLDALKKEAEEERLKAERAKEKGKKKANGKS